MQNINSNFLLTNTHNSFLSVIEPLSDDQFFKVVDPSKWFPAQILKHLTKVEENFCKALDKASSEPPVKSIFLKRYLPFKFIVESRLVKFKSPIIVEPGEVDSDETKLELINTWESGYRNLLNVYSKLSPDEWRRRRVMHPFIGALDGIMGFDFLAYHEIRHLKQLKETIR